MVHRYSCHSFTLTVTDSPASAKLNASCNSAPFVFGWSFFISTLSVVLGVGVSTAFGVFFGLYPALQASRMDPIAALRA